MKLHPSKCARCGKVRMIRRPPSSASAPRHCRPCNLIHARTQLARVLNRKTLPPKKP